MECRVVVIAAAAVAAATSRRKNFKAGNLLLIICSEATLISCIYSHNYPKTIPETAEEVETTAFNFPIVEQQQQQQQKGEGDVATTARSVTAEKETSSICFNCP